MVRIDTPIEAEYYRHGGIMPYVLRQIVQRAAALPTAPPPAAPPPATHDASPPA